MADSDACPLCAAGEPAPDGPLVVHLAAEPLRRGAWCETCALPSAVVVEVRLTCRHGWPSGRTATIGWCVGHDDFVTVPTD